MFTLRPAFPSGFYVVGAATTAALLVIAALSADPAETQHMKASTPTPSAQILAMELNQ